MKEGWNGWAGERDEVHVHVIKFLENAVITVQNGSSLTYTEIQLTRQQRFRIIQVKIYLRDEMSPQSHY